MLLLVLIIVYVHYTSSFNKPSKQQTTHISPTPHTQPDPFLSFLSTQQRGRPVLPKPQAKGSPTTSQQPGNHIWSDVARP